MKCPYCNEADTKVIDSRPADDNSSIRGSLTPFRMKNSV